MIRDVVKFAEGTTVGVMVRVSESSDTLALAMKAWDLEQRLQKWFAWLLAFF